MKNFLSSMIMVLAFSVAAFAQTTEKTEKTTTTEKTETTVKTEQTEKTPTEKDKTEAIPTNGVLKRGAQISDKTEKVSLADVMADAAKYSGKTVVVEGVIVRSCKKEGCWMELAPTATAKSVRVKMKDHAFFIPLDSAGALARVEGVFTIKTLTKEMVDHMIKEDGAKFENINADGTVTEITFEASGIELTRKS